MSSPRGGRKICWSSNSICKSNSVRDQDISTPVVSNGSLHGSGSSSQVTYETNSVIPSKSLEASFKEFGNFDPDKRTSYPSSSLVENRREFVDGSLVESEPPQTRL